MLEVILRSGPLDGQRVKLSREQSQYLERISGSRVIYRKTNESDPHTGLPRFVFQELSGETRDWRFAMDGLPPS